MLKDFKTEWKAVEALTKGLKLGTPNEAFVPDIPTRISNLNMLVAQYQRLVSAINADKDGAKLFDLGEKMQPVFLGLKASQSDLHEALTFQSLINTKTPLSQLQTPSNSTAKTCNPGLNQLNEKLSALVGAMEVDLIGGGLGDATEEPVTGAVIKATVSPVTPTVTPTKKK